MRKIIKVIALSFGLMISAVFSIQAHSINKVKVDTALFQPDSLTISKVDKAVKQYFDAISMHLPFSKQYPQVKSFIDAFENDTLKNIFGASIYKYYLTSKLMGADEVAVTMVDSLYSTNKLQMSNKIDLLNAKIYAEFNRQSLIGKQAPKLELYDSIGKPYSFPQDSLDEFSIVYFYSPDCLQCKAETDLLSNLLNEKNYKIRLYAINVDDDKAKWESFIKDKFNITASNVSVVHLWDYNFESDFRRAYGILQTPKMFLLDENNKIIGRSLDIFSLQELLSHYERYNPYVYGTGKLDKELDKVFKIDSNQVLALQDIKNVFNMMRMLYPEKNLGYKYMLGESLYYLMRNRYEGHSFIEGARYVADSLVLNNPSLWTTQNDSLQVVDFAKFVIDLDNQLPVGSVIPNIKVKGRMKGCGYDKSVITKLARIKKNTIVVFYSKVCSSCRLVLDTIDEYFAKAEKNDVNFLLVDIDNMEKKDNRNFKKLIEVCDFSALPFIIQLDSNGKVLKKYIKF